MNGEFFWKPTCNHYIKNWFSSWTHHYQHVCSGLSLLWHTPLQTPVSMEPPSEKELSNNVVSSEYGKGNKDDEHNTKAYDLEE